MCIVYGLIRILDGLVRPEPHRRLWGAAACQGAWPGRQGAWRPAKAPGDGGRLPAEKLCECMMEEQCQLGIFVKTQI